MMVMMMMMMMMLMMLKMLSMMMAMMMMLRDYDGKMLASTSVCTEQEGHHTVAGLPIQSSRHRLHMRVSVHPVRFIC